MQEEVVLEVGVLGEPSGTYVALEGPRAGVHVHVGAQVAGGRERLAAQVAFVGLVLEQTTK